MILYLDTSALVKLYVREAGSARVGAAVNAAEAVATSVVAYAETRAAFACLRRESAAAKSHRARVARFNQDWERFARVALTDDVSRLAGELAETHALRGFDAIHLASAVWLAGQRVAPILFAAYDKRLASAAADAGIACLGYR